MLEALRSLPRLQTREGSRIGSRKSGSDGPGLSEGEEEEDGDSASQAVEAECSCRRLSGGVVDMEMERVKGIEPS